MTPRAKSAAAVAGLSAMALAAVTVGVLVAWLPDGGPKQIEPVPETVAGVQDADALDSLSTPAQSEDQPPPHSPEQIALAAAQAQTLALSEEVARLRWQANAQRRICIPEDPPSPPQVAEPEIEPPAPPPEEPEEPIVLAEAPPPPALVPVRDRAPPPPPPPVSPPDPPQVAVAQPPPPPVQPPPTSDPEFDSRIRREGGQQSNQLVTLIWNNRNDLDLHVVCPNGTRVYFANITGCGSQLDIDMNASANMLSNAPVENIVWPRGLPPGRYQVFVDHYANHGSHDPTPFRVRVRVAGDERVFNGSIRHGEPARFITDFYIN